jgi:Na+/melibiose symporter-like transporter
MQLVGFKPEDEWHREHPYDPYYQPDGVLLALRWMVSFVPAFLLVLSVIANYFYPITRRSHEEITIELEKRRLLPKNSNF